MFRSVIGGRLRRLRKDFKKKKLEDGKPNGGTKGRLTEEAINILQNYYGLAATFLHKASSNERPQHSLCNISWCKYKQAQRDNIAYNHKNSLDEAVIDVIKPT